jgi:hypothetical protein
MMAVTLSRRAHYRPDPKTVARLIRILAANAALAVLLIGVNHWRGAIEGAIGGVIPGAHLAKFGAKPIAVGLTAVLAAAIYPLLLVASGGLTWTELRTLGRRRG